jgi:hypothetical protein
MGRKKYILNYPYKEQHIFVFLSQNPAPAEEVDDLALFSTGFH